MSLMLWVTRILAFYVYLEAKLSQMRSLEVSNVEVFGDVTVLKVEILMKYNFYVGWIVLVSFAGDTK